MNRLLAALWILMPAVVTAADISGVWWIKDRSGQFQHGALPFASTAAAQYELNRKVAAAGQRVPIGQHACMPDGVPRLMLAPYPIQILQRPELITLLHEKQHMVRFIYLNKDHPQEFQPAYNGDSVGRWDSDTLVVHTIGFKENTVLDGTGIPHSDAMQIVERFSLQDGGRTLQDEITVNDPKTFTRPWSVTITFEKRPDVRLMEDVCTYGPPQRDRRRK